MLVFCLLTPHIHFRGVFPAVESLPRDKYVALGETGVSAVPFLQGYYRVPHVVVVDMYP